MTSPEWLNFIALATLLCWPGVLRSAELRPVGVLGNSGYAGANLLKDRPGGFPGGVALDEDGTLWRVASTDRLERLAVDGRLLSAWRIEGTAMGDAYHNIRLALVGEFAVALFVDQSRLVSLRRDAGPDQTMQPLKLDPPIPFWYATGLGGRGLDGLAILEGGGAIWGVDPASGQTRKLFDHGLKRVTEHGLEVAPDGTLYITGADDEGPRTLAYDKTGKLLRRGGAAMGRVNAVPGGLLTISFHTAGWMPESLAGMEPLLWHPPLEVDRAGQAVALGSDTYAVASVRGPIYLMRRTGAEVTAFRRLGGIVPRALGVSSDGKVLAMVGGGFVGWHWDDPADAAPAENQGFVDTLAVQQLPSFGAGTWGIVQSYRATEPMRAWCWPPNRYGIPWSELTEGWPARPYGLGITQDGRVLVSAEKDSDRDSDRDKELYRTQVSYPHVVGKLSKVTWTGENPLQNPGEIAGWSQGRAVVVDGGQLVLIEPDGEHYRMVWRIAGWGDAPKQRFGSEVHIAASGDMLLVSDTARHRVLLFHLPDRTPVGQLGTVDTPGTAAHQVNEPAHIAANGLRVAIADRGNQRIVRCDLKP